jgi:hypothetical protein
MKIRDNVCSRQGQKPHKTAQKRAKQGRSFALPVFRARKCDNAVKGAAARFAPKKALPSRRKAAAFFLCYKITLSQNRSVIDFIYNYQ